jgi:hypothetical protein
VFRFDQLVCGDTFVRDVTRRYPDTIPVSEQLHFRFFSDDCEIATRARKNRLNVPDGVGFLSQTAFGSKADTEDHASD